MLEIPERIKDLYRSDNNREETVKNVRLYFYEEEIDRLFPSEDLFPAEDLFPRDMEPYLTIGNEQISSGSLNIEEMLCSEGLKFGECCGAVVDVVVADVKLDLTGKEFLLTVEVGGYEMTMGIYKVESFVRQQADRRLKKITAYNRMRRFHVDVADWYNGLTFPMTLKQLRDSLCAHVGLEQVTASLPLDDMQITKTIEPAQLYGLDVLRAICEINGCFGQVDKSGKVKYVFLGRSSLFPSEELFPSDDLFPAEMENAETVCHYKQSATEYEDYVVEGITRLKIRQEEGDVGAVIGEGDNTYIIQGNFLVYGKSAEELAQIGKITFEQMTGRVYRPCTIVTPAFPWVEVGDGIVCYTSDDVIETYCFRRTISGIQGMMDCFEASGDKVIEEDFGIKTKFVQLEGKAAVIKKSVEEVSVKVTDLKAYTEAQVKILSDNILLEVTRAKREEERLSASIELQAGLIALKVSKGEVSSSLSMEPDAVNLKTNRLSWQSDCSSMTQDGTLTCINLVAINGYFSGVLNSPYLGGDSSGAYLGDYSVSADGTNILQSSNGFVKIDCMDSDPTWPIGKHASMHLGGAGSRGIDLNGGTGKVECGDIYCGDIHLSGSWVAGWTLVQMLKDLYDRVNALENS